MINHTRPPQTEIVILSIALLFRGALYYDLVTTYLASSFLLKCKYVNLPNSMYQLPQQKQAFMPVIAANAREPQEYH